MAMELLFDIGNRRIKWAHSDDIQDLFRGGRFPSEEQSIYRVIHPADGDVSSGIEQQFRSVPKPDSAWVSCVGGADAAQEVQMACREYWGIQPNFVSPASHKLGITNRYVDPRQLGVDRWLAMIAARQLLPGRPLLVIDAGTAITIDFVDASGSFEGGIIIPGLMTMIESLHQEAGLPKLQPDMTGKAQLKLQNPDTNSAMVNGALLVAVSSIEKAVAQCKKDESEQLEIVITGGDGALINRSAKCSMREFPSLVLAGLYLLARESNC